MTEQAYHARGAGREERLMADCHRLCGTDLVGWYGRCECGEDFEFDYEYLQHQVKVYQAKLDALKREPGADTVENNRNDTMEYWRSRAITAEQKVLEFHAQIAQLPGADTGTTPPPDVWTCEACGYKSDDIGEYREVCGKCFSAAAERGTTPPEGLAFTFEEFIDMSLRHNKRLAAGISGIASFGHWYNEMLAATQRAPVEQGQVVEIMEKFREYRLWHEDQISYLAKKWRAKTYKHDGVTLTYDEDFLYGRETCADDLESMFKQENQATAPDHAREGALRGLLERMDGALRNAVAVLEHYQGFNPAERTALEIKLAKEIIDSPELERALADGKEN